MKRIVVQPLPFVLLSILLAQMDHHVGGVGMPRQYRLEQLGGLVMRGKVIPGNMRPPWIRVARERNRSVVAQTLPQGALVQRSGGKVDNLAISSPVLPVPLGRFVRIPLRRAKLNFLLGLERFERPPEGLEVAIDAHNAIVLVGQHVRTQQAVDDVAKSLPTQGLEQHGTTGLGPRRLVGPMPLHQIEGMVGVGSVIAEGILLKFVQCRMSEPRRQDEEARDGGSGDGDGLVGRYGRADR